MDAKKRYWGCFHGQWRAHFSPNSPLDFFLQNPSLCADKLLNLLMKQLGLWALEMYLIKEDCLETIKAVKYLQSTCVLQALGSSGFIKTICFAVQCYQFLDVISSPSTHSQNSRYFESFLVMKVPTFALSFLIWCYTSTLLHSVTGHETSVILIDIESSKLASFKNYISILAGNDLLWSWFAILVLNLGKYYFALLQLD